MGLDAKIGEKEAEKREAERKKGGESENTESLMKRYTRGS